MTGLKFVAYDTATLLRTATNSNILSGKDFLTDSAVAQQCLSTTYQLMTLQHCLINAATLIICNILSGKDFLTDSAVAQQSLSTTYQQNNDSVAQQYR